jgi:hypothetical protein
MTTPANHDLSQQLQQMQEAYFGLKDRMQGDMEIAILIKQNPQLLEMSKSTDPVVHMRFAKLLQENVEFPLSKVWADQLVVAAEREYAIKSQIDQLGQRSALS